MTTTPSVSATDPAGRIPRSRSWGIGLALLTACLSGVAIFVNGYAVRRFPDGATYTTAKNLGAALLLLTLLVGSTRRGAPSGWTPPRTGRQRLGLVAVAVVGGSIPFVLFFEGLTRADSTDAAFLHKTLVVWVAVGAVAFLGERVSWPHALAVTAIVAGQVLLAGGLSDLRAQPGELMILGATLLWSVEVLVAKRVLDSLSPLTVGTVRMAGGVLLLLAWMLVQGDLGTLVGLDAGQWSWVALTGALLAAYVTTWYAALARAQAVDVTAVLVVGAVVTAALEAAVDGVSVGPDLVGLGLLAAGAVVVASTPERRRGAVSV